MSEPRTQAGRDLLAGLADALGTTSDSALGAHGEQFRERIVQAVERGVLDIEIEAIDRDETEVRADVEELVRAELAKQRAEALPSVERLAKALHNEFGYATCCRKHEDGTVTHATGPMFWPNIAARILAALASTEEPRHE